MEVISYQNIKIVVSEASKAQSSVEVVRKTKYQAQPHTQLV